MPDRGEIVTPAMEQGLTDMTTEELWALVYHHADTCRKSGYCVITHTGSQRALRVVDAAERIKALATEVYHIEKKREDEGATSKSGEYEKLKAALQTAAGRSEMLGPSPSHRK